MFRLKGHKATLLSYLRQQRNYSFNNPLKKAVQLLQRTPFPSTSSGVKRQHRTNVACDEIFLDKPGNIRDRKPVSMAEIPSGRFS